MYSFDETRATATAYHHGANAQNTYSLWGEVSPVKKATMVVMTGTFKDWVEQRSRIDVHGNKINEST